MEMALASKRKPSMDDVKKVAVAALVAALDDRKDEAKKKPGLTGARAVATGAVIYTAGKAAFSGRRFIRDHFGANGEVEEGEEYDDEPRGEEDEDWDDEDDEESHAQEEDGWEYEEAEEPEAEEGLEDEPEAEEDFEDEPEAEEDLEDDEEFEDEPEAEEDLEDDEEFEDEPEA